MKFLKSQKMNNMKKIIFLFTISIFLLSQSDAFAQRGKGEMPKERWEKYKTEKIAFVTTNLDLSPEEAQKFWPVYNQMEKEKVAMQELRHELEQKVRDGGASLSDEEIIKLSREFAGSKEKEGALLSKYNEKFISILPPKKILKLYQVENNFKMYMFKKYRDQNKKGDNCP